jgi:hypothetical protein
MQDDRAVRPTDRGEWLSFESRMLRRRFARCLLRADLALDDGALEGAAAALREARELDASSGEIVALERRLAALDAVRGGQTARFPAAVPDPRRARWRGWTLVGFAVAVLTAAGAVAMNRAWPPFGAAPPPVSQATSRPALPPSSAGAPGPVTGIHVTSDLIVAREAAPELVEDLPDPAPPAGLPPPMAAAEPQAEQPKVVAAVDVRPTAPDAAAVAGERDIRPPAVEPAPALGAVPSPSPEIAPLVAPDRAVLRPEPAPPAPGTAVDESAMVRGVLERYEVAYSALDAGAASAIWPRVDKGALARAFEGLAFQQVSLGSCDVSVSGAAARATCRGKASWTPKVGGGQHTAERRWIFELRKSGSDWLIERASAR